MLKSRNILIIFLLLYSLLFSISTDYNVRYLTQHHGLSNNSIKCIHQDSKGFIWIGTEDGLNRFDGYTFRVFKHIPEDSNSLSHNNIRTIFEDPSDNDKVLWIGTKGGGLNKFDLEKEQFTWYQHNPDDSTTLSHNDVRCIFKDSRGNYWIGTIGGGLNQFDKDTGKFTVHTFDPENPFSISSNRVTSICEDKFGNLWIGTSNRGLNQIRLYSDKSDSIPYNVTANDRMSYYPVPEVWEYDPNAPPSEAWQKKNDMPTARWFFASCVYQGNIIVTGGMSYPKPPDTPALATVDVYDPVKDTWEALADMNVPRAGHTVSVLNKKIYALGGFQSHWSIGSSPLVVEEYNPIKNIWIRKNDLPEQKAEHTAVVLNNKLYVIGGGFEDVFSSSSKSLHEYHPSTDTWIKRTSMNKGRFTPAVCVLNGKIYVFGGMESAASAGLKSVEVYDPSNNTWTKLAEMPERKHAAVAAVVNGKIRVFGGLDRFKIMNTVFEYDPEKNTWAKLPDMPFRRTWMNAQVVNNKIYLFGGTGYPTTDTSPVARENSLEFIRYRQNQFFQNRLPSNIIYDLHQDRQGTLWIGTSKGLCKLDRKTFLFKRHKFNDGTGDITNSASIRSIREGSSGDLWIATLGHGLFHINTSRDLVKQYYHDPEKSHSINNNSLSSVLIDYSDNIWAGSFSEGVNQIIPQRKKFKQFTHIAEDPNSISQNNISSITEDKEGNLWIGTSGGFLDKFNVRTRTFNHYQFDTSWPVNGISESQDGKLWLARGKGLTKFNPRSGKFINYYGMWLSYFSLMPKRLYTWVDELKRQKRLISSIDKVKNNQYRTIQFTIPKQTKVVFVAQGEAALNELVDYAWLTKQKQKEPIWQMEAYKTRGAGGGQLNRIQLATLTLTPGTYKLHYQSDAKHGYDSWQCQPPNYPEGYGTFIFELPQNVSEDIQLLINNNNFTTNKSEILGLYTVYEDKFGLVCCLMNGVVYQFDETRREFTPYEIKIEEIKYHDIYVMYEDRSGNFWFASNSSGLIKRVSLNTNANRGDQYSFKIYKDPKVGKGNIYHSIYEDSKGIFWFGTNNGLIRFDTDTEVFNHYTDLDGLPSNQVFGIIDDHIGDLWLSTNNGLAKYNPVLNTIKRYNESDGLQSTEFGYAFCKTNDGKMYFGGKDGLTVFHPDSIAENTHVTPVVLTDLQIFNKSVDLGEDSPLTNSMPYSNEIRLAYNQNVFSFEFTALDFTYPDKNQYAHKMEDVDPYWIYTNARRRYVTYTNLDPGEYTFRVKGSNNDGIWNEAGTSLKIVITPPWWHTGWAYTLYVIFFVSVLYSVWKFQTNRLKMRHELELEHVHTEKLEEVDHLKSRFFANISHEFRTPLTLILGPLEQMINGKLKGNIIVQYKTMRRNARRLLQLINQLLDLSKLEAGKLKLAAQQLEIIALLSGFVQSFESLAVLKKISLQFFSDNKSVDAFVDQEKFETMINNLLSNAFKFTPEGGSIEVAVGIGSNKIKHPPQSPLDRGETPISPLEKGDKGGCKNTNSQIPIPNSDFIEIVISNTGSGIPNDQIDKIFDRFHQIDNTYTNESGGSGIGLALTKELVELHHGSIRVECNRNESGVLTVFTIRLPLGSDHLSRDEIAEETIPVGVTETVSQSEYLSESRKTITGNEDIQDTAQIILIVEDNIDLSNFIKNGLKDVYQVLSAGDGEAGFTKAVEKIPDLIISDVMMPKMDGFQLAEKLKNDERTSHIPVILLTARSGKEDKITGLETGADDYISKPFDADELRVRINNLIEQRKNLRKRFSTSEGLQPHDVAVTPADEKFLKRALEIIEDNISNPSFGTAQFTQEIALSRVQLHRKLHALTDQSTSQFIRSIRINRAAQLIKQKSDSITQIAYTVGFNNPSYFATTFQKQFGMSPSDYSRRNSH